MFVTSCLLFCLKPTLKQKNLLKKEGNSFFFSKREVKQFWQLQLHSFLTFTILLVNSADDKLMIFFSYFSQTTGFDISCKFGETGKKREKIKMSSAEILPSKVLILS